MASLQLVGDDPEDNKRLQQMLNDPDDKHLDPEEGEYHFSDDDISYEVETEPAKQSGGTVSGGDFMATLNNYRRVIISTVVFFLLVILVYKMVTPGSGTPDTDIMPVTVPSPANVQQAPAQPKSDPKPQAQMQQQQVQQPVVEMPSMIPVDGSRQAQQDIGQSSQQVATPVQQAAMPAQQAAPRQPAEINTSQPQVAAGMDSTVAAMAATNEKLMMQLQSEYSQRLSDYQQQNKDLRNQVQSLSSQVSGLETDIKKLVDRVSNQQSTVAQPQQAPKAVIQEPAKPKVLPVVKNNSGFSVQAIIPGRAWLRSESGETVTVAEGDKIKGLGTVTKIDPYDGVVEVNTGSKIVSISYSNNE